MASILLGTLGRPHPDTQSVADYLNCTGHSARIEDLRIPTHNTPQSIDTLDVRSCRGCQQVDEGFPHLISSYLSNSGNEGVGRVVNSLPCISYILDKSRYLQDLVLSNVPIVHTSFIPSLNDIDSMDQLSALVGSNHFVIKPNSGSRAARLWQVSFENGSYRGQNATGLNFIGQTLFSHIKHEMEGCPVMIQPFQNSLLSEGEFSLIVLGGVVTHAIRKMPASGGWIAHEDFGGVNVAWTPSREACDLAMKAMNCIQEKVGPFMFARLDMLRCEDGKLAILEVEAATARLFLETPELIEKYASLLIL